MAVGIDLVKVSRLENKDDLAKKILSSKEFEIYQSRIDKAEFLAGRFAVKEAFIKAKNSSILDYKLKNIEVLHEISGKPYIIYENNKYDNVSISHEKEYAIAIVIL